jgi:hypothetical protein
MLQVEHIESRYVVLTDVTGVAADLLIAAGAERLLAGAGENHHADLEILAGVRERVDHLADRERSKRVADLRPVDRQPRDAVVALLEDDVLIGANAPPIHIHSAFS